MYRRVVSGRPPERLWDGAVRMRGGPVPGGDPELHRGALRGGGGVHVIGRLLAEHEVPRRTVRRRPSGLLDLPVAGDCEVATCNALHGPARRWRATTVQPVWTAARKTAVCSAGSCSGGTAIDCSALDDECNAGLCSMGLCQASPINEGGVCNSDPCMTAQSCAAGSCSGGIPVAACTSGDQCCPAGCDAVDDDCGCTVPGDYASVEAAIAAPCSRVIVETGAPTSFGGVDPRRRFASSPALEHRSCNSSAWTSRTRPVSPATSPSRGSPSLRRPLSGRTCAARTPMRRLWWRWPS